MEIDVKKLEKEGPKFFESYKMEMNLSYNRIKHNLNKSDMNRTFSKENITVNDSFEVISLQHHITSNF